METAVEAGQAPVVLKAGVLDHDDRITAITLDKSGLARKRGAEILYGIVFDPPPPPPPPPQPPNQPTNQPTNQPHLVVVVVLPG